ncbi:MAG: type II/IV secretion system ATPase subunit [Candidatus Lokiarchaeota archaeon]|nr:type II/IV secretion system ATPase subunit [Candidatus Lokiarchaeota archaeon]
MELSLKNNKINQDEKIDTLSNNVLNINCEKCSNLNSDICNENCFSCLSKSLYSNKKKKITAIYLESFDCILDHNKLYHFIEYHSFIENIKYILKKIKNFRKKCNNLEFKCPLFSKSLYKLNKTIEIYNPILFYNLVRDYYSILINFKPNSHCLKCYRNLLDNFKFLIKIFSDLGFIDKYNNFKKKRELFKKYANFYEYILSNLLFVPKKNSIDIKNEIKKWELFENYNIEKYSIYKCEIYKIKNESESIYIINRFFDDSPKKDFYIGILNEIYNHLSIINISKIISIENLLDFYHNEALKLIDQKYKLSNINKNRIGLLIAIKILNLEKIFPLLIDNYIEEIFLDSPNDRIYINHQKFGRCRTVVKLDNQEIERIKTLFRLYSGHRLDHSNPSIKLVLKNKYFYCRFAVDIEPINFQEFSLDIRKLNKNIFTIQDLIKNKTLNPNIAAFLYLCLLKQANITVAGATDSGKTTLINALDLITPKDFRKIYVENVIESLNEIKFGKHQLKYKVDSIEDETRSLYTKSNQIKKLLHRTPDLIYLGEILTEEESKAMFHCLAAGLKGFQTIHADNIDSLINRFIYHFKIDKACLNDLDIVILMKKYRNNHRRIFSINEIWLNNNNSIVYHPIFQYNPENDEWDQLKPLFSTKTIKNLVKFEYYNQESFNNLIDLYMKVFKYINIKEKIKNEKLIQLFDNISYFSNYSVSNLENFIENLTSKI